MWGVALWEKFLLEMKGRFPKINTVQERNVESVGNVGTVVCNNWRA